MTNNDELALKLSKVISHGAPGVWLRPIEVNALLAERDADKKRIADLNDTLERECEKSRRMASRIAELEAREVTLPELKMLRDYLCEVTMREREDILLGVKLEFHRELQAAGIRINGEG